MQKIYKNYKYAVIYNRIIFKYRHFIISKVINGKTLGNLIVSNIVD